MMKTKPSTYAAMASAMLASIASVASADPVRHVPPAGATAQHPVELEADAPATSPTLKVHYRRSGQIAFAETELVRKDNRWIAIVPATAVAAPGLEYYLEANGAPVFASAQWPHTMRVAEDADDERRTRDLTRFGGARSRIHTSGELVNFGTRVVDGKELVDRYYRIDADFSYRLWAYPLDELRVGYTRLVGETESSACPDASPCTATAGFRVAGWFELGLAPVEGFRLDGRAMVMATAAGFGIGGRAEARLGMLDGSHVALGVEHMADVGTAGFFRLGWGTVPLLPMTATVEVTNLPDPTRDTGVRLYYDIARVIGSGVRLGARVGYAARNQNVAGFTGGATASVDF
ncbi:MAG TPA: hypothetical protein VFQ53_01615 [Kofleriaceae bacterium]|nr:hypothetical protein [Kofleriaceae bacterium]